MAVRIKSHWHKDKSRPIKEIAATVGFHIWQTSINSLTELEKDGYAIYNDEHRLQVMSEFLAFLLQVSDRLAYEHLTDTEREVFVTAAGHYLANAFADNKQDLQGSGEYKKPFIELLNLRSADYAEMAFSAGEAQLDFLRYFGERTAAVIGEENRRWVSQHVIEITGPSAVKTLKKSMDELMRT